MEKEEVLKAMLPLMNSVLDNLKSQSPAEALTGPIQRGDTETLSVHLQLLRDNDALLSIYKDLGLLTLELADLDKETDKTIRQLLK